MIKQGSMNKKHYLLTLGLLFCFLSKPFGLQAQVGYGTNAPMASAVLDLDSNSQGFLPPRMTQVQMLAIASPAGGLVVYCIDCFPQAGPYYYNGADFVHFAGYDLIRLSNLDCSSAVSTGTLYAFYPAVDTNFELPYTAAQGGVFREFTIQSTGVLGLEATVFSRSLGSTGNLFVNISGTPTSVGTATFPLSFGGQACTLEQEVLIAPVVASLNCAGATDATRVRLWNGYNRTLDVDIPYTGGNGEAYPLAGRDSFPSRGVTGLTATILPGTLANGAGNIRIRITGTPSGVGQAYFDLDFGTQTCTYQRAVTNPVLINGIAVHRVITGENNHGGTNDFRISTLTNAHGISRSDLVSHSKLTNIINSFSSKSFNTLAPALGLTLDPSDAIGSNTDYLVSNAGVYTHVANNRSSNVYSVNPFTASNQGYQHVDVFYILIVEY